MAVKVTGVKYLLAAQVMERAEGFWVKAFGARKRSGDDHWTELTLQGSVIALHSGHDGSPNPTGLSLDVNDIDEAARVAQAAGASIRVPPHKIGHEPLKLAELTDTEGNEFMLAQQLAAN